MSKTESMFLRVAKEFASAFETAKRDSSGETFWRLKDDAPEWMRGDAGRQIMFAIHGAMDGTDDPRLPSDWVYEHTSRIADELVQREPDGEDDAREPAMEIADSLVDVYNADRARWLGDHLGNAALVDEACTDLGVGADEGIYERIAKGQYLALERIANAVIDAIAAEAETRDEDDE